MQQAGDAEGAVKKKRWRTWLLRIGAVLLALGFVSPSCITLGVWGEDRNFRRVVATEAPDLDVFPARSTDGIFLIRLSAARAKEYVDLPVDAADPIWLQVTPLRHGETVAVLLALENTLREPELATARPATIERANAHLLRLDSQDGNAHEWRFALSIMFRHDAGARLLSKLPGFTSRAGIYPSARFETPCNLTVLETPPTNPGTAGHHVDLARYEDRGGGTPWIVRVLWTPLSLLADAVTAPIQLLFTL